MTIFIIAIENTKQLKNETELKKRCNICHISAQTTGYLTSYLVFCFEHLKHVPNFRHNYSRTQEPYLKLIKDLIDKLIKLYLKLINDCVSVAR